MPGLRSRWSASSLEPLGGITAMGIWGTRLAPEFHSGAVKKDWYAEPVQRRTPPDRESAREVFARSLARGRGGGRSGPGMARARADAADVGGAARAPLPLPPRRPLRRQPAQVLDVWRRKDLPAGARAGADLPPGRRLGARQPDAAGHRAAVTAGRAGLGVPGDRLPRRRRTTAGRATSSTSRPPSRGRAPTSTSSAATAISLRWRVVRPAATCPRWLG